jgi:glycogen(starch) synthase
MRLMVWSTSFWPHLSGVEVLATCWLTALRERGHDVRVVTLQDSPHLPADDVYHGIPVHRVPVRQALASGNLDELSRLRAQVADLKRRFQPDLVHVYHAGPEILLHQETLAAHPVPVLVTLHQSYPDRIVRPETLHGNLLRSATWVTACSRAVLAHAQAQLPEIRPRSSVIPNSLPMPALPVASLPFDPPRLLCLGRVVAEKGFDLALGALARLAQRYPQLRLVVAGDGAARAELTRRAAELAISDRVDFIGWVPPGEVPALLNACTIVLVPSRHEPFGLVALQAAQMARPVVATAVGGLPEVVADQDTGLLIEPNNAAALAGAVGVLLENPDAAAAMGRAARSRAQDRFAWTRYVDAYDRLISRLVSGGTAA